MVIADPVSGKRPGVGPARRRRPPSVRRMLVNGGGSAGRFKKVQGAPKGSDQMSARFPISRDELPHFASMSVMMFLFIYVFTTVRDTKDTLVVSNCGAESIPFLKLYAVMPCATAFIVAYSKLSNLVDKRSLFHLTLLPFFAFYGVFAFVLFPMRDRIHFPLAEGARREGGVREERP